MCSRVLFTMPTGAWSVALLQNRQDFVCGQEPSFPSVDIPRDHCGQEAELEKRWSDRGQSCSSGRFGRVSQERVLPAPLLRVLLLEVCSGISAVVYVVVAFSKAEKEIRNS